MTAKQKCALLTFTGLHDPYAEFPVHGMEQQGPVLGLLNERSFQIVVLFSTPLTAQATEATREAISEFHPEIEVHVFHLALPDPTDYAAILTGLRARLPELLEMCAEGCLYIATASGTPQMHACWLLLASSGEIPARLIYLRPPQFVTRTTPHITEIDLSEDVFPEVRVRAAAELEHKEITVPDLSRLDHAKIVGDAPGFIKALGRAMTVAPYDEPVLIQGANGTGKDIVARLIHQHSSRHGKKLVTINCSAIPGDLAESILFGHKKGSFTGAVQDSLGKFALADGGTLFLDEIAELPPAIQAKLLRAVEYQEIEPLGASEEEKVNVRLVTATNKDLPALVDEGEFREDLYYRLRGAVIRLPSLSERRGDISKLAVHFLDKFSRRYHKNWKFTQDALCRLQRHTWPGNVRELEHVVREAAILCGGLKIKPEHLELLPRSREGSIPDPHEGFSLEEHLGEVRQKLFNRALELAEGKQAQAARLLGVSDTAVSKFVRQQKT